MAHGGWRALGIHCDSRSESHDEAPYLEAADYREGMRGWPAPVAPGGEGMWEIVRVLSWL
jgi:hypothetical protein